MPESAWNIDYILFAIPVVAIFWIVGKVLTGPGDRKREQERLEAEAKQREAYEKTLREMEREHIDDINPW